MKNCCYFGLLIAALVSRSGMSDVVHTTFGMSDEYASVGTPVGHAGGVSQVNITEAQSFSIPDGASYRLDSFEVALKQVGSSKDDRLLLRLFSDDDGEPGVELEEYFADGITGFSNRPQVHVLESQTSQMLAAGRKYWIVGSTPDPGEIRTNERIAWAYGSLTGDADRWWRFEFENGAVGAWERPRTSLPLTLRVNGTRIVVGDYNENGVLDVADLDLQAIAMSSGSDDAEFDLNDDGSVDISDRVLLVEDSEFLNSFLGDSTLDAVFSSADLVSVFQSGKYETEQNASWAEGDWNGDTVFSSRDLVVAFQSGGYENGPRTTTFAVPEPSSLLVLLLPLLLARNTSFIWDRS